METTHPDWIGERNIATILQRAAESAPAQEAIRDGDAGTTYGRLSARAGAIRSRLLEVGLRRGARSAIWLDRGADAAAAFFGTVAMGGIAIMVNETLRPRQVEHILRHSGASILLTTSDLLERQPRPIDTDAEVILVTDVPEDGGAPLEPVARLGPDPAQIIYTSGSTGLPKGVTVSHGNLLAGTASVSSYVGIDASDRIASLLPFSFDYGFNQLLCAVANRATLVVDRSPIPASIVATLDREKVTVLPCVPPLWLQLLNVPDFVERPLPSIRAMTNTGGRLPVDAVRRLRATYPDAELFLMYGLTEAFRATYLPPSETDGRPDSIGRAIPGCEIMVLREDGTECEPGETGELVQRGATVALGYWDDPEATARVFRPNPGRPEGTPDTERVVFSGDLVKRDEDGFLYFVSRRDAMIKSLGYRVSPDEIVEVLHASGQIVEAAVKTEPDEIRGSLIIAFVVLREGGDVAALQEYARRELPRYMQPARIEVRDALPRTSSGKHDARSLR